MPWNKYKYVYLALLLIFLFSGGLSFYKVVNTQPQNKPKISVPENISEDIYKVSPETQIVLLEKYTVCQKYDLKCSIKETEITGEERTPLNGLTLKEIQDVYALDNRTVEKKKGNANKIFITQWKEGLCPEHKNMWHLGANNSGDFVAVYYGPGKVQDEGGIYKVTEIPVDKLPSQYQDKVRGYSLEFNQEEELIATLDSFSEFLD